jgi:hypothetical protein
MECPLGTGLCPIFHKIFSGVLALTNLTRLVDFLEVYGGERIST